MTTKSKGSLWFHYWFADYERKGSGLKTSQVLESLKAFLKKHFFQGARSVAVG